MDRAVLGLAVLLLALGASGRRLDGDGTREWAC